MANLYLARTGQPLAANPVSTLIAHFSGENWTAANPPASDITFGYRFSDLSKLYQVVIKHLRSDGPAEVLGSGRYRVQSLYKVHVVARGTSETDSIDKKFAIEQEIKRIVKTAVTGLQSSGFDEIRMEDDFVEIETGNVKSANKGIAADAAWVARSAATIRLIYDACVA